MGTDEAPCCCRRGLKLCGSTPPAAKAASRERRAGHPPLFGCNTAPKPAVNHTTHPRGTATSSTRFTIDSSLRLCRATTRRASESLTNILWLSNSFIHLPRPARSLSATFSYTTARYSNMAATQNGLANGVNGDTHSDMPLMPNRFSHIEPAIDIPFYEGGAEQTVEINLVDLLDDPTELCTLLENENVEARYWMTIALAYAKQRKMDHGIEILRKALGALGSGKNVERLSILSCLCWMYLWKCREAPRVRIGTAERCRPGFGRYATALLCFALTDFSRCAVILRSKDEGLLHPRRNINPERRLPNKPFVPSALPRPWRPPASSRLVAASVQEQLRPGEFRTNRDPAAGRKELRRCAASLGRQEYDGGSGQG